MNFIIKSREKITDVYETIKGNSYTVGINGVTDIQVWEDTSLLKLTWVKIKFTAGEVFYIPADRCMIIGKEE